MDKEDKRVFRVGDAASRSIRVPQGDQERPYEVLAATYHVVLTALGHPMRWYQFLPYK